MSRTERDKGARFEREVVHGARAHGLRASRTAALQANGYGDVPAADVTLHDFPDLHLEAKRCERLAVPAWIAQAERDAPAGSSPVVIFRRSHEPARVIAPADLLFRLLSPYDLRD